LFHFYSFARFCALGAGGLFFKRTFTKEISERKGGSGPYCPADLFTKKAVDRQSSQ